MNYVVIWSAFEDAYVIRSIGTIGPRIEIKTSGTQEQCAAWIASQR